MAEIAFYVVCVSLLCSSHQFSAENENDSRCTCVSCVRCLPSHQRRQKSVWKTAKAVTKIARKKERWSDFLIFG